MNPGECPNPESPRRRHQPGQREGEQAKCGRALAPAEEQEDDRKGGYQRPDQRGARSRQVNPDKDQHRHDDGRRVLVIEDAPPVSGQMILRDIRGLVNGKAGRHRDPEITGSLLTIPDGQAALDRILQSLPGDVNLLTKRVKQMAIRSNFGGNSFAAGGEAAWPGRFGTTGLSGVSDFATHTDDRPQWRTTFKKLGR